MIRIQDDMRKIKVIHVITRMDMGGSAQNTLLTCLGIDKDRHEVILVYGGSAESNMTDTERNAVAAQLAAARAMGVRCLILDTLVRRIDPLRDLRAAWSLWRLCRAEKPDIVHTHTSKAGFLGRWAAWLARVPVIIHTPHGHVFFGHFSKAAARIFFLMEKLTALITHTLVALTRGEKKDYLSTRMCRPEKVAVIHSGVDVRRFGDIRVDADDKKASLGIKPGILVVGTVGWLLPIKGPEVLLEAMALVWREAEKDVALLYVGKGEMENNLRRRAREMGVSEKVCFAGWRDDIPEIMQIIDIFVFPSRNEGMGRVLVEAMAAKKPVIGTRVGGIPDLIIDGETGFLVPAGDAPAFSQRILWLLGDAGLRQRMGEKGGRRAKQFGIKEMNAKIARLYEDILFPLKASVGPHHTSVSMRSPGRIGK